MLFAVFLRHIYKHLKSARRESPEQHSPKTFNLTLKTTKTCVEKTVSLKLDAEDRISYPKDKTMRPQLKRYLNEMSGVLMGNVWTDIAPINSQAQERLGYPTQKPEALLERISSHVTFRSPVPSHHLRPQERKSMKHGKQHY